jgi:hypothetical protein
MDAQMRILVIEDERTLAGFIEQALRAEDRCCQTREADQRVDRLRATLLAPARAANDVRCLADESIGRAAAPTARRARAVAHADPQNERPDGVLRNGSAR